MCDWLARLTTESKREAISEQKLREKKWGGFVWHAQRQHVKTFSYLGFHPRCYCCEILPLWPYLLACTHARSCYHRANQKQWEVKIHLSDSQMKCWKKYIYHQLFPLSKQSNNQTANDNCHSQTSANHWVILLSCDFLSFPFLHQKFRGQEDLSAMTERIMGVGIPLAVITALSQHLVLSLPFFPHPLSLCLFSLLSSDRVRSN